MEWRQRQARRQQRLPTELSSSWTPPRLKPVPVPPAWEKQNTALKQSQLINPLDLLICCVTLAGRGERIEEAGDRLSLHPGPILSDCFYLMSRTIGVFLLRGLV